MKYIPFFVFICLLFAGNHMSSVFAENDVRMNKDDFNALMNQLQGMKTLIEEMKQDYNSRLDKMQEKIAALEKEKAQLTEKISPSPNVSEKPKSIKGEYVKKEEFEEVMKQLHDTEKHLEDMELRYNAREEEEQDNIAATQFIPDSAPEKWSPTQPITLWSAGRNYMDISFDGLFSAGASTDEDVQSLFGGGHDPNQRGFTLQQLETTLEGTVDPYFRGVANILFQLDDEGESFLEVEEAYLTSLSLPLNLQVKAGTFLTEFGRFNETHPHSWDFIDQPLVNNRFFGADGLRNPGARFSWLAPTENYTELFIAVQDSQGETAHSFRSHEDMFGRESMETDVHNLGDMLYTPRVVTAFELTDEQTLMLGSSASFGPNSTGGDQDTIIYGIDMFWKWKSKTAEAGFPFVTWQTEVMGRRFEAGEEEEHGLSNDVFHNWGAYSQINWGFKKRWVAGFRADYVDGLEEVFVEEHEEEGHEEEEGNHHHGDGLGFERVRLSPNITFFPTEFSKIRLQYNYDNILGDDRTEHSVFLQFEFLLGSHGAHKF
ncbi:MAG: hypothetical protein E3K37_16545 [Candidatus Kuenenia sp.]|nr:hypothetical protein [Candidatus Kuenenia hertensis]